MLDLLTPDQEKKVKQLKRRLESWREFLVTLYSVLIWEKPWYPLLIFGIITSIFTLHWCWDPSLLTTISIIFLVATLMDYLVPKVSTSLLPPERWTAIKEKQYEILCQSIVEVQDGTQRYINYLLNLKNTKPRSYFMIMFTVFGIMAWIGNSVNNTLLTHLIVTSLTLAPGFRHHQLIERYTSKFFLLVSDKLHNVHLEKIKRN